MTDGAMREGADDAERGRLDAELRREREHLAQLSARLVAAHERPRVRGLGEGLALGVLVVVLAAVSGLDHVLAVWLRHG